MLQFRQHRPGACVLAAMVLGCAISGGGALVTRRPYVIWNVTASAPRGLYFVADRGADRGDLVLVPTPSHVRQLAAERGYVPADVPLVKRIAAGRGDIVCGIKDRISINGGIVATRRTRDRNHRLLPRWNGCRSLGPNDIFLLMADAPASFDGRYFGITRRAAVIGRLVPLWTE